MKSAHPSPATIRTIKMLRIAALAAAPLLRLSAAGRRIFLLVILYLLLPWCMNNNEATMAALSPVHINAGAGRPLLLQSPLNLLSIRSLMMNAQAAPSATENENGLNVIPGKSGATNNAGNANTPDEKKTTPLQPVPDPIPALTDEPHTDMHDNSEEENTIHISFSRLMRIALIVLFAVLII